MTRETAAPPALAIEDVPLPSRGVAVPVRAVMYSVRARIEAEVTQAIAALQDGATDEAANIRLGAEAVLQRLARYVTLDDGRPLWSRDEWDAHMAQQPAETLAVYDVVRRLNGLDGAAVAKN